jgi:hypothetical protein
MTKEVTREPSSVANNPDLDSEDKIKAKKPIFDQTN